MAGWSEFAQKAPQIAAFGEARFGMGVAYLGTLRSDGSPRVHPVTPVIAEQLFLFMEPTSPKGKDLLRDPRFTLHCSVADSSGAGGEFYVRGVAHLTVDPLLRAQGVQAASYVPEDRYILFVCSIEHAFMKIYTEGSSVPSRWSSQIS